MYTYHLVNGITGEPIEPLTLTTAPSWARRPEPVAWAATVNIRPNPVSRPQGIIEGNPMAGLQHRIVPWRDTIVISWRSEDGQETALAAGIVSSPLKVDERAGTLSIDTVCMRTLMEHRFIMRKTIYPMTKYAVTFSNLTWSGLASECVKYATSDYQDYPPATIYAVRGFGLPIDRPPATPGPNSKTFWGYAFTPVAEALDDIESEGGVVIDFNPYWTDDGTLRWAMEVFTDAGRTARLIDLGSTSARTPQAEYRGQVIDASKTLTYTHVTGKGSEIDVLYTRRADFSPTVMTRETLVTRPDVETRDDIYRAADAANAQARKVTTQDDILIHLDAENAQWVQPDQLWLGATIQLTLEGSLAYGDATLRRTLIGWSASGDAAITLDVQEITTDIEA